MALGQAWHRIFPPKAAVERLGDDGIWRAVPMADEMGNEQHNFPDTQSALLALVRHVHKQFHRVLLGEIKATDLTPPDHYRITEISEH